MSEDATKPNLKYEHCRPIHKKALVSSAPNPKRHSTFDMKLLFQSDLPFQGLDKNPSKTFSYYAGVRKSLTILKSC